MAPAVLSVRSGFERKRQDAVPDGRVHRAVMDRVCQAEQRRIAVDQIERADKGHAIADVLVLAEKGLPSPDGEFAAVQPLKLCVIFCEAARDAVGGVVPDRVRGILHENEAVLVRGLEDVRAVRVRHRPGIGQSQREPPVGRCIDAVYNVALRCV